MTPAEVTIAVFIGVCLVAGMAIGCVPCVVVFCFNETSDPLNQYDGLVEDTSDTQSTTQLLRPR